MRNQKFLTLEDLCNYFTSTYSEDYHFSTKETGKSIVVQVPAKVSFESDDNEKDRPDLFKITLYAAHTGDNVNKSHIEKEAYEEAKDTFANKPILAYIHEVDGQLEFYTHNMHDEDGEIVYDEVPVGVIPEDNNFHFEVNEENGKEYVVIVGYVYEQYSKAAEIIRREKTCFCSMEIEITDMAVKPKESAPIRINSFSFSGITLLGKNEEGETVNPGMSGAHVEFEDFSKEENSMFSEKICEKLAELNEKLDKFANLNINYNTNTKGGEQDVTKFEELLKKYDKTEEDITFEIEGLSDEELEKAFAEAFEAEDGGEDPENGEGEDPDNSDGDESTNDDPKTTDDSGEGESEGDGEGGEETTFSKTFELSHDDIRTSLYTLLSTFEEEDNDWYYISAVYDDYFIYEGVFDATHKFKQSYTHENDEVSFSGDRIHVNVEYVTDNELAELNKMRSNYAEISEKLAKYEAEPQKVEKIQSDEYAMIRDTEEFKKIESEHFDLSVEEIGEELDKIVLSYAKAGKVNFAKNEEPKATVGRKVFGINTGKTNSRYGSLFNKDK